MKYKNFIKFHQKTILKSKIQNFNNILKKQNVHNRLYNDSIKKKKVLNDLQLKYMAAEAKQYTFIPTVNHNCNIAVKIYKSKKSSYKTPLTRKNTQRLETPGKMKEVFSIKRNFGSKWNKSEKKNVNEYSKNKIDIGTYYIKDKSKGIYKKVNNNKLKSQLLKQRNTIKSFHKSILLNTNKKDGLSKLTTKNLEFNNNSAGNNNNRINIRINTNINNQLLNDLNTYRLKNHKYFTTINNLFKDDIIVNNNFLYNANNPNHYNNKTIQENKPHYKEYSNIQISITDAKTKNSVIKNNSKNKKINSKNRLNNHSISNGIAKINFQNNMLSSIKKERIKESNISFKTLEFSRNISDCFSILFNNYLKQDENKIQYGTKQLENRKIRKNIKNKKKKINKVKTSINSISSLYNLYNDKIPCNDNNYFHSIDYGNNLINNNDFNNTDNNCYFIREKNKFLYTNSKEILFDLSNLNNNDNKNNNSEIKAKYYTLDLKHDKDNSGFKDMDLNHKSKIKNKEKNFHGKIDKNKNLILNTNNKVKKDLLPELNKNNIINNKLKIEHFNFNTLGENYEKSEIENKNFEKINNNKEKLKKLSLINIGNNYIQNENNIYMKNKIKEKSNIKEKINTKTNINNGNKTTIKKGHIKNIMNEDKKDYMISKKGNGIENEENNNFDKMSIQSMSDSKIYELANNYMKNEDLIDKHQINNILFNKKNKNI